MEHAPIEVALSAVYLAVKAEGDPWGSRSEISVMLGKLKGNLREVLTAPPTDESLRRHEMALLTALRHQLLVFHPFRSIIAFLHDASAAVGGGGGAAAAAAALAPVRRRADAIALESLFTDACLECTPGAIGLACVRKAASEAAATGAPEAQAVVAQAVVAWCDALAADAGGDGLAGMQRATALLAAHEVAPSAPRKLKKRLEASARAWKESGAAAAARAARDAEVARLIDARRGVKARRVGGAGGGGAT